MLRPAGLGRVRVRGLVVFSVQFLDGFVLQLLIAVTPPLGGLEGPGLRVVVGLGRGRTGGFGGANFCSRTAPGSPCRDIGEKLVQAFFGPFAVTRPPRGVEGSGFRVLVGVRQETQGGTGGQIFAPEPLRALPAEIRRGRLWGTGCLT